MKLSESTYRLSHELKWLYNLNGIYSKDHQILSYIKYRTRLPGRFLLPDQLKTKCHLYKIIMHKVQ